MKYTEKNITLLFPISMQISIQETENNTGNYVHISIIYFIIIIPKVCLYHMAIIYNW